MRVFALSDIHADYQQNRDWIQGLSDVDYQQDILLLAGDVSDKLTILRAVLESVLAKFSTVHFVPGNHELWVRGDDEHCSLEKFQRVQELCAELGVLTDVFKQGKLSIVPLLSWYDFSFGEPDRYLRRAWRDFRACNWPQELPDEISITRHFLAMNKAHLNTRNETVISFSHFLPSIDVMPERIPQHRRKVYPVLGSNLLGEQLQELDPDIHVYGHSHVNQAIELNKTWFINNAFAYPDEERIARKHLLCVWDSEGGVQC